MFDNLPLDLVLDDLQTRFIINIPPQELASIERICFQIEQAHWFYEDFVREENPTLPSFSLKKFAGLFFSHCPLLHSWSNSHEKAFDDFMQYKVRVPVCGAIILNKACDKALLVRGYKSSASWSFPRGKINKDEALSDCAVRECLEEIGFDISPYLNERDLIQRTIREQQISLFIVKDVPEDTDFQTQTRKEIGDIKWFKISSLPGFAKEKTAGKAKFYMIVPFAPALKRWIDRYATRKRSGKKSKSRASKLAAALANSAEMSGNIPASLLLPDLVGGGVETGGESSDIDTAQETPPAPHRHLNVVVSTNMQGEMELQSEKASRALKELLGISRDASPAVIAPTHAPGPPTMVPVFGVSRDASPAVISPTHAPATMVPVFGNASATPPRQEPVHAAPAAGDAAAQQPRSKGRTKAQKTRSKEASSSTFPLASGIVPGLLDVLKNGTSAAAPVATDDANRYGSRKLLRKKSGGSSPAGKEAGASIFLDFKFDIDRILREAFPVESTL